MTSSAECCFWSWKKTIFELRAIRFEKCLRKLKFLTEIEIQIDIEIKSRVLEIIAENCNRLTQTTRHLFEWRHKRRDYCLFRSQSLTKTQISFNIHENRRIFWWTDRTVDIIHTTTGMTWRPRLCLDTNSERKWLKSFANNWNIWNHWTSSSMSEKTILRSHPLVLNNWPISVRTLNHLCWDKALLQTRRMFCSPIASNYLNQWQNKSRKLITICELLNENEQGGDCELINMYI